MTKVTVSASASHVRWVQLFLGLIAMMAISSPQYVWTLFVKSFQTETGGSLAAVQVTFSILVVLQTWLSPAQGWLVDRFGPRLLIMSGAALSGLGWVLASNVSSLWGLYLTYGLFCGMGTGIVYIGIIGLMVRWFPDLRGMATGVVAAGYGIGAIFTTFPIDSMLRSAGIRHTLLLFGLALGVVGVLASLFLRAPAAADETLASVPATVSGTAPGEMLKSPIFWLMFVMMTMMSTGGLMVISQFAAFSKDFGTSNAVVLGLSALPLALSLDRFTNGFTRPFFGWVSDRIGRENTMGIAFGLEAVSVSLLLYFRQDAAMFVVLSGLVFFGWGEIFSLFPATLSDTFGNRYATTNYGLLYMAQGIGSILGGPVAALLKDATGSWVGIFAVVIIMDALTALLALFVLKPMRRSVGGSGLRLAAGAKPAG